MEILTNVGTFYTPVPKLNISFALTRTFPQHDKGLLAFSPMGFCPRYLLLLGAHVYPPTTNQKTKHDKGKIQERGKSQLDDKQTFMARDWRGRTLKIWG